jgi:hypothetical protein
MILNQEKTEALALNVIAENDEAENSVSMTRTQRGAADDID